MVLVDTFCHHGYKTERPDGSDPYRKPMNVVVRHMVAAGTLTISDLVSICKRVVGELQRDHATYCDGIFLDKLIAFGLGLLEKECPKGDVAKLSEQSSYRLLMMAILYAKLEEHRGQCSMVSTIMGLNSSRDQALFFYRRAPCSCFRSHRKITKAMVRRDLCEGCSLSLPYSSLLVCSQCQVGYCSETCQRSDWLRHKPLCQLLSVQRGAG